MDHGKNDALAFGAMIRARRKALNMLQEDLALVSGLGRRFVIELEAGKPTARLGPALHIARLLGMPLAALSEGREHGALDRGLPRTDMFDPADLPDMDE